MDPDVFVPACTAFTAWSGLALVANVNSPSGELGAHEQADGRVLYFARSGDLYMSTRSDPASPWSTPTRIDELSTAANEDDPSTTADGLEMWFTRFNGASPCPFVATRQNTSDTWSAPVMQAQLCPTQNAAGSAISLDGLRLYYTAVDTMVVTTRTDRSMAFTPGSSLGTGTGTYGSLSSDELSIYFEDANPRDIFVATRADRSETFGTPMLVPGINSPQGDEDASISTDGTELMFSSDRAGGDDLYVATRTCL